MESQVLKPEAYLHFVEIQPRKLCLQLLLVTPHLLQLISQLGLTLSCLLASQIQLRLQPQAKNMRHLITTTMRHLIHLQYLLGGTTTH